MADEKMSPLPARMMEDMRIRGMGDKAQKSHIRAIKDFTKFLGWSPDAASSDDLRASEVCNLKISDIDRSRMLIHVDQGKGGKDRKVMLSLGYRACCGNTGKKHDPRAGSFQASPRSTRSHRVS